MIDQYKLISVSHKGLNTEDLEHFIVRHADALDLKIKLQDIKTSSGQEELLYLATCNRVIFFFFGTKPIMPNALPSFFKRINPDIEKSNLDNLNRIIEYHEGVNAVNHIFEVSSSIDSLVVGEREIFRQFRDAYHFCNESKLCDDNIRLVQKAAVKAAKDVYTNTSIGTRPVSVVSLAIQEFLKRKLPSNARILLLGAGETNRTVGRFLKKHQFNNIVIFNRSLNNAKELSDVLNAESRYLGDLKDYQYDFDAIFTCTASQDPVLTQEIFDSISKNNNSKLVVDLSIPHNVSKSVSSLDHVDYISIDNLRSLAEENLEFRSGNINQARELLAVHNEEFRKLFERRKVERALSHLPQEISKIKDRALNVVYKDKIESLPLETQELISEIAEYLEKKCVAAPMKMAKKIID